jgi:hypothetical protein
MPDQHYGRGAGDIDELHRLSVQGDDRLLPPAWVVGPRPTFPCSSATTRRCPRG